MNANQGQAFPNSQMDTHHILVGELRNAIWLASQPAGTDPTTGPGFPMRKATINELNRGWAQVTYGGNQALSVADYEIILGRDAFSDPNNQPSLTILNQQLGLDGTTPQNRFVNIGPNGSTEVVPYVPGNNPSFSETWASSSQTTYNVKDTYSMKWQVKGDVNFIMGAGGGVSDTMTLTDTAQVSQSTNSSNQTSASIYGPSYSWNGEYGNIAIYRDTLYQTYLFVPVTQ